MNRKRKLGVVMDAIQTIHVSHDSSLAMMFEAQKCGFELYYTEQHNLFLNEGVPYAKVKRIDVALDENNWFEFKDELSLPLEELDVILMRKDPPFDINYIYTTYLLEQAEHRGTLVVNKPTSLRDANEKLFTAWFPECCPKTLVTSQIDLIKAFLEKHQKIILKPLHGMAGQGIFCVDNQNPNIEVIVEILTHNGQSPIMAQRFIPEVKQGDKRIILIDGKPIPYAMLRKPKTGQIRSNFAAGGSYTIVELSDHDYWICEQIGKTLHDKGLIFVGIDVIGDYLTEINVTSPTGAREIENQSNIKIFERFMDKIESLLKTR